MVRVTSKNRRQVETLWLLQNSQKTKKLRINLTSLIFNRLK